MKLPQGKFRWDIRKRFLTQRLLSAWKRLPREAVTAPSSGSVWTRLSPYGLISGGPARSRELDSMALMDPFQLELFCDSMNFCLLKFSPL